MDKSVSLKATDKLFLKKITKFHFNFGQLPNKVPYKLKSINTL